MEPLTPSERGPGLLVGRDVELAEGVDIGAHVVIHSGVSVGEGCMISHHAVLGRPPLQGSRSRTRELYDASARLELAAGALIGCGTVVLAGARIGEGALIGDHVLLREHVRVGSEVVIGHGGAVGARVSIGARTKLQNNAMIAAASAIEEDVFVGPSVAFTNDPTIGRRGEEQQLTGVVLRRGCRIAGNVILLPGVEVGEDAVVGAGSVVTRSIPPRTLAYGSPARPVRAAQPASRP